LEFRMLKPEPVFKSRFHICFRMFCFFLLPAIVASAVTGCGIAGVGVFAAATGGGGSGSNPVAPGPGNSIPVVFVTTPVSAEGDVTIPYRLTDTDCDSCTISISYGVDNAEPDTPCTPASGSPPLTGRNSSDTGVDHTFVWDTAAQLGSGIIGNIKVRVIANDGRKDSAAQETDPFTVDNTTPPVIAYDHFNPSAMPLGGNVEVHYNLSDIDNQTVGVSVMVYSDGNSTQQPVLLAAVSPGLNGIATLPTLQAHLFVWDTSQLGTTPRVDVYLVFTPDDTKSGSTVSAGPFSVNNNAPPEVSIDAVLRAVDNIPFTVSISDPEGDVADLQIEYSVGGAAFSNASIAEGLTGLASGAYPLTWLADADLGSGAFPLTVLRVTANDANGTGTPKNSNEFTVGNDAPVVEFQTPSGVQSGDIAVLYSAKDTTSDSVNLDIEFRLDNASAWTPAKPLTGIPVSGIISAPDPGVQHVFVWESFDNVGGVGSAVSTQVQVRLRLSDIYNPGIWVESGAFTINNNQPPIVQFTSIGDVAETSLVGIIPIRYMLLDAEADVCSITIEGSLDGSDYFTLEEFPGGYENKSYSQGAVALSSSPSGVEHLFIWHPYANGVSTSSGVYIRFSVSDAYNSGNPAQVFTTKQLTYRQSSVPQVAGLLSDAGQPYRMASGDFNNDGIDDIITGNNQFGWNNCTIFAGQAGAVPANGSGVTIDAGGLPKAIGVGDFDNDGISDFVIVRDLADTCWVYRGKNGSFPTSDLPWILRTGFSSVSVVVGDYNDDGIDDFAVGAEVELVVKLYLGKNGGLPDNASAIDLTVGNYSLTMKTADLNNNGIDDLIVLNIIDNTCTIFPGRPVTGPSDADGFNLLTNNAPRDVAVGDFNGDGLNDFAIACSLANNILVFQGLKGSFPADGDGITLDIGDRTIDVGAGDFNGDGIDEIVTTNIFTHSVTIFPGQIGAMPQNGQEMVVDVTNLGIAQMIDDFNNDGLDDLIVIANSLRFFPGMAGLFFTEADTVILLPQAGPNGRALGDYNGDGLIDIAIYTSPDVTVFVGREGAIPKLSERHVYGTGDWPYDSKVCDIDGNGVDDIITADVIGNILTVQANMPAVFPSNLNRTTIPTGTMPIFLESGDYNFDGLDDVAALAGGPGNRTAMLIPGQFGVVPTIGDATYITVFDNTVDIMTGDFNNDGIDDFFAGLGDDTDKMLMLYPGKSGSMPANGEETVIFGPPGFNQPRFMAATGDFNCDGLNDIATADFYNNTTTILIGQPGAFPTEGQSVTLPLITGPTYVTVGDFNCDGIDDLAFAHETSKDVVMYPGGDGVMPKGADMWWLPIPFAGVPYEMSVGDFNADGIDDLVLVHHDAGDNATIYFGRLGGLPLTFITVPLGDAPEEVVTLDINGDGIDDFVTADELGPNNTIYLGSWNPNAISSSRTTLAYGERPHKLNVVDSNADGLKTFVSLDMYGSQVVMYKRFLCSPCLNFKLTPEAVVRQWKNDYWRLALSIPAGTVTENTSVYMMHTDYLALPRRSMFALSYRHASTAVKFMPETHALGGAGITVTMPFLDGISQADIDYAKSKDIVRVFRWEREFDNGDGTFGRLVDVSTKIVSVDTEKRNVSFLTDRLGIFQIAIEYLP